MLQELKNKLLTALEEVNKELPTDEPRFSISLRQENIDQASLLPLGTEIKTSHVQGMIIGYMYQVISERDLSTHLISPLKAEVVS